MYKILAIVLWSSLVLGQIQISGTITDAKTGLPLKDANIVILNSFLGASSDAEGKYQILSVPQNRFKIRVSMMGYRSEIRTVNKDTGLVVLDFALVPTVLTMAPLTVIGQSERNLAEQPQLESAGLSTSMSVIRHAEIERQGAKTVVEALHTLPGALTESRGRKVKQFVSFRGQRYPYPEYSIDGVWQREFHELPYLFSSADIERIEVIRSSAALLTGINGMAGVINIVPKNPTHRYVNTLLEAGSYGTLHGHVSHGNVFEKFSYAAGMGYRRTAGPEAMNAEESILNGFASINWQPLEKLQIHSMFYHISGRRELRLAEPPAMKRFLSETSAFDPVQATISQIKVRYRPSQRLASEWHAFYADRQPVYEVIDKSTGEPDKTSEADFEWGLQNIQTIQFADQHTLRFGGLYNHWIAPNGKRFYTGRRNDLHTVSAVIVDEMNTGRLNVDVGFRWSQTYLREYGAFNINGSGKRFKGVEPIEKVWEPPVVQFSAGASFFIFDLTSVHVNMAYGQVKPQRGTLDTRLEPLKTETRFKLDMGVRSMFMDKGELSLTGFVARQEDAIVLSGKTFTLHDRIYELYENRDQFTTGLEGEGRFSDLLTGLDVFANATVMSVKSRTRDGMQTDKTMPEFIASGGLYYQNDHWDATFLAKRVSAFENTRFVQPLADGRLVPEPLGDFVVLDLILGYTFEWPSSPRLYIEAKNLNDTRYSTVAGYPDFGRTFVFGLSQTF
jgi:outer membrane receptor protein involved in Fe transport